VQCRLVDGVTDLNNTKHKKENKMLNDKDSSWLANDLSSNAQILLKTQLAYIESPAYNLKPKVFLDGDKWCALYGNNIQEGVVAFGDSPNEAFNNFDKIWHTNVRKH